MSELIGKPSLNPNHCSILMEKVFSSIFLLTNKLLTEIFHSSKFSLVLLKADFPARRLQRITRLYHSSYHSSLLIVQWSPQVEKVITIAVKINSLG
jgi:hypothetical protein